MAILISIKPEYVCKILNKEKILEIRKSMPKCELPCKVYIYCTKGKSILSFDITKQKYALNIQNGFLNKQVVAEFTLNKVEQFSVGSLRSDDIEKLAYLSYKEMIDYFYKPEELDGRHSKQGYAWHIDDLIIYDEPKELSEFSSILKRMKGKESRYTSHYLQQPPQDWCYVEEKGE